MLAVTATSTNPAVPDPFTYVNDAGLGAADRTVEVTIWRVTENCLSLYGAFDRWIEIVVPTPPLQVPVACRVNVDALVLAVPELGVPINSQLGAAVPIVNAVPPAIGDVTDTVWA